MATRKSWTRDELLIALNLYHKLTFGQMHARQAVIVDVARKLGRGANSLAMKLCNFASLDPALKLRGIKGLEGASALDRSVWREFHEHLAETAPASEQAFRALFSGDDDVSVEVVPRQGVRVRRPPTGPTSVTATVKVRRGQEYFREIVLNNFGGRCGVSGLDVRELLVASHIAPWAKHEAGRLEVTNGLCLSRLHDAAFDHWLISFDDDLRLLIGKSLKQALPTEFVAANFSSFAGAKLKIPDDGMLPSSELLAAHRKRFQFG